MSYEQTLRLFVKYLEKEQKIASTKKITREVAEEHRLKTKKANKKYEEYLNFQKYKLKRK